MALAFLVLLLNQTYNHLMLSCLFFAIGIMCCYQVIIFAAGSRLVLPKQLGVTVAFLNCINMLGGSFFHTSIGQLMDIFWTGTITSQGLKVYDLEVYQYALSIIPACSILGAAMVYLISTNLKHKKS